MEGGEKIGVSGAGIAVQNERILKKYIEGKTIFELVKGDRMEGRYIDLVRKMAK